MTKVRAILFFSAIMILALGANSMAETGRDSVVFFQEDTTTRAVVAAFLASEIAQGLDTAISITHLAVSDPVTFTDTGVEAQLGTPAGVVTFFLWDQDGNLFTYTTSADTVSDGIGQGLSADGTLDHGATFTVLLSQILTAAGADPELFVGHGMAVAPFALTGTYNALFFEIGFTQSFVWEPAFGSGGFFGGLRVTTDPGGGVGIP